jgi:hypothetical protein
MLYYRHSNRFHCPSVYAGDEYRSRELAGRRDWPQDEARLGRHTGEDLAW